ncbi:MAG TPA: glycosyltransferase family 2 protein [Candidatus Bathyarchaeia archaeon]|nr:glycosyltransferase family 2 protein [Candidatus Bathyarchaeia archaeon]
MKKITLSIIILSFNTCRLLKNCLKSLYENSPELNFEVIVIDNNSQDESVKMLKELYPRVRLFVNKKNLGFARGNNQGIRKARGNYVLFLNSDTLVHRKALIMMVNYLRANNQAGVIGCRLLNIDGSNQSSAGLFPYLWVTAVMLFKEHFRPSDSVRGSFDKIKKVDWVMGAAMMLKKKVLDEVGVFDEHIFMYMDELELCYRIKRTGYEVVFYPEAKITHLGRGSSETGKKDPILNIYRGLIYFYKKHRSLPELAVLRLMLKLKAFLALIIGCLTQDKYLKGTYAEAFRIS